MAAMVGISAGFFIDSTAIRIVVIASAIIGCIVVGFVVPTVNGEDR